MQFGGTCETLLYIYRDSLTEVGRDTGDDGPSTAAAAGMHL